MYHWISIVFLLYGRRIATHSVDPSLTHFLGEFPGVGLALVPDVVVPKADSGAHGAENSTQISALAGVEPRTLASRGRAPLLESPLTTCRRLQQYNSDPEPAGETLSYDNAQTSCGQTAVRPNGTAQTAPPKRPDPCQMYLLLLRPRPMNL